MIKEHIKNILKWIFGRNFEIIVRRPYIAVRKLLYRPVRALRYCVRGERAIHRRISRFTVMCLHRWQRTLYDRADQQAGGHGLYRVIEGYIQWSERRYRNSYCAFRGALDALSPQQPAVRSGILLMIGTLGPGGAERQAVLTLQGLGRRGVKPLTLCATQLKTELQRFHLPALEAAGIACVELRRNVAEGAYPPLRTARRLPADLPDVADYMHTLNAHRPMIAHLWLDDVNIRGGLAAVATGVPSIVLSTRSMPPYNFALYQPYMREGYRWLMRQPGVTMCNNSVAGARAYEHWLGLSRGRVRVVYNGFDFDEQLLAASRTRRSTYRARHGIPQDAMVVGTVIRLSEEKRPLLWAGIAARVRRLLPDTHFLVIGDGPLRKRMEARSNRPDLAGYLHLVGHEKLALAAMAAMDLFLLTSREEGLPNVLIEAQALGVPVVTTPVGGAPETLVYGQTGWSLASDKPDDAGITIVRLLRDKLWLEQAGMSAKGFVKERFAVERMIDETLEAYGTMPCREGDLGTLVSKKVTS